MFWISDRNILEILKHHQGAVVLLGAKKKQQITSCEWKFINYNECRSQNNDTELWNIAGVMRMLVPVHQEWGRCRYSQASNALRRSHSRTPSWIALSSPPSPPSPGRPNTSKNMNPYGPLLSPLAPQQTIQNPLLLPSFLVSIRPTRTASPVLLSDDLRASVEANREAISELKSIVSKLLDCHSGDFKRLKGMLFFVLFVCFFFL